VNVQISHKLLFILSFLVLISCGTQKSLKDLPDVSQFPIDTISRTAINDTLFVKGVNSLRKNKYGLWELYVEANNPYQLGVDVGSLTQELIQRQEKVFLEAVDEMVPSKFKQYFLRKFLTWYGRKMYLHILPEYKTEMLGISNYGIKNNAIFENDYQKTMLLHSAHDIGHALQDLALVGCSSFAVWGSNTEDGKLVLGRNFDFYAGDAFATEKLVSFVTPSSGYSYLAVSWAGMIGIMSGMNEKGLTVTINAGKSDIPLKAKTPISLVTREILQYASTLDEAIAIAKKREVFVSESIMVGSAIDNRALLIEMAPNNFGVYNTTNSSRLICTNHFQSEAYTSDKNNIDHIKSSHSKYRFDKLVELLPETKQITPTEAVSILRNTEGLNQEAIGYGNEKALNQLLAHHGVVFKPSEKKMWVSANPYQMGAFVCYDMNTIAEKAKTIYSLAETNQTIAASPFLETEAYKNYQEFRKRKKELSKALENNELLLKEDLEYFINLNPDFWEVYYLVGSYYYNQKQYAIAQAYFEQALSKEVTTLADKEQIQKYITKSKRRAK